MHSATTKIKYISCLQCNEKESIKSSAKFSQSHIRNLLSISSFC